MASNPIVPPDIDEAPTRILNVLFTLMGKFPGSFYIPFFGTYIKGDDFRGRRTSILLLLHQKQQCTMTDITKLMKISASVASKITDPLIEEALVERRNDPLDRRIIQLTLTDKGKTEVNRLFQRISFGVDALLDTISEEEQKTLIFILEKMGKNFQYPVIADRLFGKRKSLGEEEK